MVVRWSAQFNQIILFATLLLPSSLYAGSRLRASYSISQQPIILPGDGHPLFCQGCPRPYSKATLILKRTERPGRTAAGWGASLNLRGGNSEEGNNETVANEVDTPEVSSSQPRGWGLTAEQSALYNNSLEEAGSMEYEVMAFLQVY
jgi:hypothetical protein